MYPTKGGDLEAGESVIIDAWATFFRMKLMGIPVIESEGLFLLTNRRVVFAPMQVAKMFAPMAGFCGPPGALITAAFGAVDHLTQAKSLSQITRIWPSGESSILKGVGPRLSIAVGSGDEYEFAIASLDKGFSPKANTKTRDELVNAIQQRMVHDSP